MAKFNITGILIIFFDTGSLRMLNITPFDKY